MRVSRNVEWGEMLGMQKIETVEQMPDDYRGVLLKLIYALADAALVVSSDYEKGGTWAGAVEQLEKLQFVPVYVRSNGFEQLGSGGKGALVVVNMLEDIKHQHRI